MSAAEGLKTNSILLIEDDPHLQFAMMASLEKVYNVVMASKVSDARYRLSLQPYACIVLDLNLAQGGNGADLIPFIRREKESQNKESPILLVSGILDSVILQTFATEINAALVKPFTASVFRDKMRALCSLD